MFFALFAFQPSFIYFFEIQIIITNKKSTKKQSYAHDDDDEDDETNAVLYPTGILPRQDQHTGLLCSVSEDQEHGGGTTTILRVDDDSFRGRSCDFCEFDGAVVLVPKRRQL